MATALESALARHRLIAMAALVGLTLAAWAWLLAGAGMDMPNMAMGGPAPLSGHYFALVFAMWWVMMVAMMLPSAAPMILLYARVAKASDSQIGPATGSFMAGYLLAWAGFSFGAALLQCALDRVGLISPMTMALPNRWLWAAVLIAAALYQFSPIKDVCLRYCRSPAQFLTRHFRPGPIGALRMGLLHGAFCVGCCWLLMALLFVGGVMNIAWIALLTLVVAAEKLLPHGRKLAVITGACLLGGGLYILK